MANLVTPREKWMSHFVKHILLFLVSRPACRAVSSRLFLQFPRSNLSTLEILPFQALTLIAFPFPLSLVCSTLTFCVKRILIYPFPLPYPTIYVVSCPILSPNTWKPTLSRKRCSSPTKLSIGIPNPRLIGMYSWHTLLCACLILISHVSLDRVLRVTHAKSNAAMKLNYI